MAKIFDMIEAKEPKVAGKGLSANDYTDAEKTKLTGIEEDATADQSDAEIKAAYENNANTNALTDTLKTKLDGIEDSATSDQTGAEIKTAYELEDDTNALTDALKTKLDGIEDSATSDQTGSEIKTLYEGELDTNAYTDTEKTKLGGVADSANNYSHPASHSLSIINETTTKKIMTDVERTKLSGIEESATADMSDAEIKTTYENNADTNALTDTLKTKLDGIETNATADQSDAEIKTAYENNADTNAFTDTLKTKLDGIEASATADQTGSEIKTAYEGESNTNAYTDAEKTKLAGLETSKYLGTYLNLTALQTAYPTPVEGSYAHVDAGFGSEVEVYIWDDSDTAYKQQMGASSAETSASVKTKYEANADTNAFTDALKTKLDGIESSATADQSDAEIKTAYENNADTNAFTDAEQTKLSGIADSANNYSHPASHTEAEISDLNKYSQSEIDTKLTGVFKGDDLRGTIALDITSDVEVDGITKSGFYSMTDAEFNDNFLFNDYSENSATILHIQDSTTNNKAYQRAFTENGKVLERYKNTTWGAWSEIEKYVSSEHYSNTQIDTKFTGVFKGDDARGTIDLGSDGATIDSNINAIVKSGFYSFANSGASTILSPTSVSSGTILHIQKDGDDNHSTQTLTDYSTRKVWVRAENIGIWSSWLDITDTSKLVQGDNDTATKVVDPSDATVDAIVKSGFYSFTNVELGSALYDTDIENGVIIHTQRSDSSNYAMQQLFSYSNSHKPYYRLKDNGTWGSWVQIYSENNKPTATDVGLGNVSNTSDADKPISTATQTSLDGKLGSTAKATDSDKLDGMDSTRFTFGDNSTATVSISPENNVVDAISKSGFYSFIGADLGDDVYDAGVVDGIIIHTQRSDDADYAIQQLFSYGSADALCYRVKDGLWGSWTKLYSENNKPTKSDVGLSNVDNTSDANKPVSTAVQTSLDLKTAIADIVDNGDSTDSTKPLSANYGRVMETAILNNQNSLDLMVQIANIADNLISIDTDKPLSANQGKILKGLIDALVTTENDFTTVLKTKLDGISTGAEVNDANTTLKGNTFNGNSQLVETTADGKLPAIDGSNLTGVTAFESGVFEYDTDVSTTIDLSSLEMGRYVFEAYKKVASITHYFSLTGYTGIQVKYDNSPSNTTSAMIAVINSTRASSGELILLTDLIVGNNRHSFYTSENQYGASGTGQEHFIATKDDLTIEGLPVGYTIKVIKVGGVKGEKGDTGDIPEAPNDGNEYVRKDGAWEKVPTRQGTNIVPILTGYTGTVTEGSGGTVTVSASSEYFDGTYQAWKAFDQVADWATDSVTTDYFYTVEFSIAKKIWCWEMSGRTSGEYPDNIIIQGSNDNSSWEDLGYFRVKTQNAKKFILDDTNAYTYFRVFVYDSEGTNCGLRNMKMYETR